MEINYPPYKITDKMLNYVSDIMKKIGEANYFESLNRYPELRRKSRIKSIHSSLAIECIKRNVLISAKEIIEETNIPDRTVRRILKKLLDNNNIETIGTSEKSPNKKFKLKE